MLCRDAVPAHRSEWRGNRSAHQRNEGENTRSGAGSTSRLRHGRALRVRGRCRARRSVAPARAASYGPHSRRTAALAKRAALLLYCLSKILQRQLQAGFEIHFGLPAEQPPGLRDIRSPLLGIVLRQRLELNLARRTAHRNDFFGALQDREFNRIPDVHGLVFRRPQQANDAIDLVANVAKTARLAAIAEK